MDFQKEILNRASQEAELYTDLVTSFCINLVKGKTVADIDVKVIIEKAMELADGVTSLGIAMFNSRIEYWTKEATKEETNA